MRIQWLIGQFPGRERLRCRIVGRKSVQVKAAELNQRNSLDRVRQLMVDSGDVNSGCTAQGRDNGHACPLSDSL